MLTIETARFVPISAFDFPDELSGDVSSSAPFSFGDNNRSMVLPHRIADHLDEVNAADWQAETERLRAFEKANPGVYIDLEN